MPAVRRSQRLDDKLRRPQVGWVSLARAKLRRRELWFARSRPCNGRSCKRRISLSFSRLLCLQCDRRQKLVDAKKWAEVPRSIQRNPCVLPAASFSLSSSLLPTNSARSSSDCVSPSFMSPVISARSSFASSTSSKNVGFSGARNSVAFDEISDSDSDATIVLSSCDANSDDSDGTIDKVSTCKPGICGDYEDLSDSDETVDRLLTRFDSSQEPNFALMRTYRPWCYY